MGQSRLAKPGMSPPHHFELSWRPTSTTEGGNDALLAELKTVQYELSTIKQERQLVELRHEKELREVQRKAEVDFKRAQVCVCLMRNKRMDAKALLS